MVAGLPKLLLGGGSESAAPCITGGIGLAQGAEHAAVQGVAGTFADIARKNTSGLASVMALWTLIEIRRRGRLTPPDKRFFEGVWQAQDAAEEGSF